MDENELSKLWEQLKGMNQKNSEKEEQDNWKKSFEERLVGIEKEFKKSNRTKAIDGIRQRIKKAAELKAAEIKPADTTKPAEIKKKFNIL